MTGAVGMILSGVISMDEAYRAVSWKTVFLLAGLLPLGHAVEASGAASYLAQHAIAQIGDMPAWVLQTLLAVLATLFTLVISNVGATVLLVPIAINLALSTGASPAMFALTVAISTSNSFLLPTHQVNALIFGPGGYRVADFLRTGSIMTVLFLVVTLLTLNVVF
jgi:di/tricarboxylate transporter